MSTEYPVPASFAAKAHVDAGKYEQLYARSVGDNEAFWADIAKRLDWVRFPTRIKDVSFDRSDPSELIRLQRIPNRFRHD